MVYSVKDVKLDLWAE